MTSHLIELYRARFGSEPDAAVDLRADGSNRRLYRLFHHDGGSVVGVFGPEPEENRAFLAYSAAFGSIALPVPVIYAADESLGVYLEEDLGDVTLYKALVASRQPDGSPSSEIRSLYHRVVELLPRLQIEGDRVIDYALAWPTAEFDRESMMWDLNYFKYHFLKLASIPFNESRLERDLVRFVDFLDGAERRSFMYRDFQSRNIMIRDGKPWLIDYQGGRRGPLQYDVASLLYDAKADLPETFRQELLEHYLTSLEEYSGTKREEFVRYFGGFVLVRLLQAMGAYGYRGFFERKPHFLASVPYAVGNIRRIIEKGLPVELPELQRVLERIVERDWTGVIAEETALVASDAVINASVAPSAPNSSRDRLTIVIRSFSYRRGYPEETSEHGGGFVFDCRGLPNPGRLEEYKRLTGRDSPVVRYLEGIDETEPYWQGVRALVDSTVATYTARNFEHLSVGFGCTGGQHRSVYFAERLAQHIAAHYPDITVDLAHREALRWPVQELVDDSSRNPE
jgi:aminoglycoside/choline kinase family phosphotransferase